MFHDKMTQQLEDFSVLIIEARKKRHSMRLKHVLRDTKLVIRDGKTFLGEEHSTGEGM